MELFASTGAPLLLVNLVFAAIALAVGFAAGAWVCGSKPSNVTSAKEDAESAAEAETKQLVFEQTLMASDRLRDLASSVATDVGAHSANIDAIEAELVATNESGGVGAEAVLTALHNISAANEKLNQKLQKAEDQIQTQAELIRTHESEARTDSLTSLANRRAFDDELNRRFAEWTRFGTPFSLLILDVDHFKKFNDTHGHQAGDEVLRQVGTALVDCAREIDLPCRYGGEEFAVVMPATEGSDGCPLAERVRSRIESLKVQFEGKTLSVTTSLGLADVLPDDDTGSLIKRADEALYAAKDSGRNNAHRHVHGECVPITPGKTATAPAESSPAQESETAANQTVVLDALPNRTRFLEILRSEVRTAQDAGAPLSVLIAEFEGYKQLEREFGEAIADLTLDSIAQFLDNAIQENDVLGRLGTNEFIVLMPTTDAEESQAIGSRINAALANCRVPLGEGQLKLSTAMSITELRSDDTAVTLMKRCETTQRSTAGQGEPAVV